MTYTEIAIPIANKWPTSEELQARNAVEAALDAASVGICTGAGGGMGQVDLTFRVDDQEMVPAAREVIDRAMKAHMPNFKYNIRVHVAQ